MRRGGGSPVLPLLGGLLLLFLLAPFVAGLGGIGAADWRGADRMAIADATLVSVLSATVSTALLALGGVPLGFVLARAERDRGGGRGTVWRRFGWRAASIAVQLPLALPPLSSGVLLLLLFGYASPLGHWSGGILTDGFAGIVLAEAFVSAPFLVIAARSAFRAVDPALPDMAATMGHRPTAVFGRVSMPIAARGILAGAVLAWLRGFGEFGATMMVAYHPYSLPVFTSVAFGGDGLPAMLPVIAPTLLAAVAAMGLLAWLQRERRRPVVTADGEQRAAAVEPLRSGPPAAAPPLELSVHLALDGFALHVDWETRARRVAILGASGSGKSMTLRAIAGLEPARLRIGGRVLDSLPPERRGVALVPQGFALLPHLPVRAQLDFAADADPARARFWAERLGLGELMERRPDALSPGQQQRVALGRALSRRGAQLLLLDEPFSALDVPLRVRLRGELDAVLRASGMRTVLVTHDPAEAMRLADALLLLHEGRVLQSGPVDAVFARPATESAALLLGAVRPAQGVAVAPDRMAVGSGVVLRVDGAPLPLGPVGWAVRPDRVRVTAVGGEHPGKVLQRGPVIEGGRMLLLRLGDAQLEVRADPDCVPEGACRVEIDPGALQVWPAG